MPRHTSATVRSKPARRVPPAAEGWSCGRPGGLPLRAQQPRLAAARGDVPGARRFNRLATLAKDLRLDESAIVQTDVTGREQRAINAARRTYFVSIAAARLVLSVRSAHGHKLAQRHEGVRNNHPGAAYSRIQ
jgi:hypothetical protein